MDVLEHYYSCELLATSFVSVVGVGSPLVILRLSPRGADHLLNTYEERHNASYRGTVDLRLHSYQDSSRATSRCQQEKYTQQAINKRSIKSSCHVPHKHFLGRN